MNTSHEATVHSSVECLLLEYTIVNTGILEMEHNEVDDASSMAVERKLKQPENLSTTDESESKACANTKQIPGISNASNMNNSSNRATNPVSDGVIRLTSKNKRNSGGIYGDCGSFA